MAFVTLKEQGGTSGTGNTFGTDYNKGKNTKTTNKPIITVPSAGGNTYSSGSYYGGGYDTGDYGYDDGGYDYQAWLDSMYAQKIAAQQAAIQAQVDQAVRAYQATIPDIQDSYQTLKNQSEVQRYKAQKSLRENQANRGALDSGVGRQEGLNLQNNYGNNLTTISSQEQKEIDAVNRAIADVQSQGEIAKAQASIDGSGDMTSWLNSNYANLASGFGGDSAARTMASDVVSRANQANNNTTANITYQAQNPNAYKTFNTNANLNAKNLKAMLTNGKINSSDYKLLQK